MTWRERLGLADPDASTDDAILNMIATAKAAHASDPFPPRRPVWRDPSNPAEQALTWADNYNYTWFDQAGDDL